MGNQNVLDVMTAQYTSLSKSGQKIIDYIFANKRETQYLSITALAEACGVAEATVSRLVRSLGYTGYNAFKLALARAAGAKAQASSGSAQDTDDVVIASTDSIQEMSRKLYLMDTAAISQTLSQVDETAIARAVQYMHSAQRVYCFGSGASMVMAMEAWARFSTAAPQFHAISDAHMQTMAASLCSVNDVILLFSYSGATKDMQDVLRPAKERGAKIILITHFAKSPATRFADVVLLCGSRESPLQSGGVAAKIAQMFVIDILFHEFCRQNPAFTSTNLEITAGVIAGKLL